MEWLLAVTLAAASVIADDLRPSCYRPVYCNSELLHHVQLSLLYHDSKTFVDMQLRQDETTTLQDFQALLNETSQPSKEQLKTFVDHHFQNNTELQPWTPTDYVEDPKFLENITDPVLRQFGKDIHAIWPSLGRKVKEAVFQNPEQSSLIPVPNGFVIPGGRFKELYYWDSYWIIKGLLIGGMQDTAKGMIENLLHLLKKIGHIPNGNRWYYQGRSQPPLLIAMMTLYYQTTKDINFFRAHIDLLEKELEYWLNSQIVAFEKDGKTYTLLRYYAPSSGPRPESYYEDYTNAQAFPAKKRKTEFYIDIKSVTESGWDFSSRWLIDENGSNSGNLTNIHTKDIIPVDLNAIFANALERTADFQVLLGNTYRAEHWRFLAAQWRNNIQEVFWNEDDSIWYDFDIVRKKHRKYFYPSNVSPLWMNAVDREFVSNRSGKILGYLRQSKALEYPGGIPTSLIKSGQQWDFPNAWPHLISIVATALENLDEDGQATAFELAQTWVRACLKGFEDKKQFFEKYDVEVAGKTGGGGEYGVQKGFGWTNGVLLGFLERYGGRLKA